MGDILLSVSRYKAKKDHVCSCCGRKINKGEFYIREFGKADGEPFDSKLHNRCYSIKERMINELCPDVYDWEEVYDFAIEKYCKGCGNTDSNGDCLGNEVLGDLDPFNCPYVKKRLN